MCLLMANAFAAPNPGPPTSSNPDGPQTANVPYVAWVGEHVRLVVCDPSITPSREETSQFANYQVEDWSGYQFQAPTADGESGSSLGQVFDPGPAAFFPSTVPAHEGDGCVATDYKSLNPGLARIRVVVRNSTTGEIVFSHQFLVIWLTIGEVKMHETGSGEFIPSPFSGETGNQGLIQIKVTGSFPVISEAPLHNVLPNPSYTLPADWNALAEALASSSEESEPPGANPSLWDIHGLPGGVGPYDPQVANETLLSNGVLNEEDAPMPALRIDVSLAANKGGSDLGGVGQIEGANKTQSFASAYIPATDRPGVAEVSGIDGPSPGGDFPGFLNAHPEPYKFWTSVKNGGNRESESTGCLRRLGGRPESYETPRGFTNETFYTDELGNVYLVYTPGDGFYLNHIPVFQGAEGETETGKIIKNEDGACDLKGLSGEVIGESAISARAIYPYEPVDYSPVPAAEGVTEKVRSAWEKEWFEFPKGPGKNEQNVRIVVAKAQDIDGRPMAGETVCFHAEGASVAAFTGSVVDSGDQLKLGAGATVSLSGTEVVHPTGDEGLFCETTNSQGLAGIELDDSSTPQADLTATYVSESGIIRDHEVSFAGNKASEEEAAKNKEEAKEAAEDEAEAIAEKKQHEAEEAKEKQELKEAEEAKEAKREKEKAEEEKAHKEAEEKEIGEKKSNEELEAAKKAREAEEAANNEKRKKEATEEKQKDEEKEAAEKAKREKEEKEKAETRAVTTTTTVLTAPLPSVVNLGAPVSGTSASAASAKPLTAAQKLARALKACKKQPHKKRPACEAQARKAFKAATKKK